jgi:nicotinamide-nucleotide amidase
MASQALKTALKTARFVIVTGGLGSTEDDLTCEIVANALDRPLCRDKQMFELIKGHAEERGVEITPSLEKMAWMPEGSKMLNPAGTACGFFLKEKDVHLYFLPGVPDQMRYLLDKFVLPQILRQYKTLPLIRQRIIKLYGLPEPDISEIFRGIKNKIGNDVILGFYPHFPENHITASLRGENESTVMKELSRVEMEIRRLAGPYIFATENQTMEEVVGQLLTQSRKTLSVAESCTGGLIGHRLTNVPGSSRYFQGGVVVYSNGAKQDLLGVSHEILKKHGAVSDPTAREMAKGVKAHLGADLGLAVTGIAGPDGGSKDKPVGTVHIGLAWDIDSRTEEYRFWGNREQVKSNTSTMALDWLRRHLNGDSFLPGI